MSDNKTYVVDSIRNDLFESALKEVGIESLTDAQKITFDKLYEQRFKSNAPASVITKEGEDKFLKDLQEILNELLQS